jgi:hypothetical protein
MTHDELAVIRDTVARTLDAAARREHAANSDSMDWREYDQIAQDAEDAAVAMASIDARQIGRLVEHLDSLANERTHLRAALKLIRNDIDEWIRNDIDKHGYVADRIDALQRIDQLLAGGKK